MSGPRTYPSGPSILTRSVSVVPVPLVSITCSKVILMPGERDSSTHALGLSARVTVRTLAGNPLAFVVILAPTRNAPSIEADSMWSCELHLATSVHAAQTAAALARVSVETSYVGTTLKRNRSTPTTGISFPQPAAGRREAGGNGFP